MKKTYISPAFITVQLTSRASVLISESTPIDNSVENSLGQDEILTKENNVSDVNLWDNEW